MGVILYELLVGMPPFYGETVADLFYETVNNPVVFPKEDDEDAPDLCPEVKDLILLLLEKDPARRLGTPPPLSHLPSWEDLMPGAYYVKEHDFFLMRLEDENGVDDEVDWDNLLLEKANFIPNLDDELDTSYFDDRADRYHHELSASSEEDENSVDSSDPLSESFKNFACVNPMSTPSTPVPGASPGGLARVLKSRVLE
jgi:microtubule-associated serine/threonine kinase